MYLLVKDKLQDNGVVVGIGEAGNYVLNLDHLDVIRNDKAVHDDSEIALLVGDIAIAAGRIHLSMADYNNKCNTRKKYRQYSHQGVKCSYHTTFLNGGKNIVLHTFYTI